MNNRIFTEILTKYGFQYMHDDEHSKLSIPVGIGDILFKLAFVQQQLKHKPLYINLDIFITGRIEMNKQSLVWFDDVLNAFIFRIKLLSDICENNENIKKEDIIFFTTKYGIGLFEKMETNFNYSILKNFKLYINPNFFNCSFDNKVINFIKDPFIIIHTKLRLNNNYNYQLIKYNLNNFFKHLYIKNFNIIIMGEKNFENNTPEKKCHNITTIYNEISQLKNLNNDRILDLSVEELYNSLDYDRYKHDICLINKASYNICFGQGGQLCSSLLFGKCMFFDPIDETFFFQNMNLYNSGHRYFKRLYKFCEYLVEIL
jgi:hypothetical protein